MRRPTRPPQRRYSRSRQVTGLVNLAAIVALAFMFPGVVRYIAASILGLLFVALFLVMMVGRWR